MRENANIKYWTETSAKSGVNIEMLFLNASKYIYYQMMEDDSDS